MMTETMVSCAEPPIKRWEQLAARSSENGGRGEVQVEFSKQFQDLTADVISHTGFGSSYKEGKEVFHTQKQLLALAMATLLNVQLPGFKQVDLYFFSCLFLVTSNRSLPFLYIQTTVWLIEFFTTSRYLPSPYQEQQAQVGARKEDEDDAHGDHTVAGGIQWEE
jgi:hypothetical protein